MSVTNGERLATKQDLADMYQGILPYLGGMPEVLANKFSKGDMYSTDEKMIGQWIDGKPLYQKSFYATNIEITSGLIAIGDLTGLSIDKGYVSKVFGMDSDYSYDESRIDAWLRLPNNNIGLKAVSGVSNMNLSYVAVTIQYTKTTDSAILIGDDTDYSTEEKIVGTWIDGRPIYQRTYEQEIELTPNTWVASSLAATNVNKVINGIGYNAGSSIDCLLSGVVNGYFGFNSTRSQSITINAFTVQYLKTT